jgi:hypothetical protein
MRTHIDNLSNSIQFGTSFCDLLGGLGFGTWNKHLELGQMGAGEPVRRLLFCFFSLVPSLALLRSRSRLRFRPQRLFICLFAGARSSRSSISYGVAVLDSPGECDFSAFSYSTL